jgi:hypothetical protein
MKYENKRGASEINQGRQNHSEMGIDVGEEGGSYGEGCMPCFDLLTFCLFLRKMQRLAIYQDS